jgi:hypothetical protein
MVFMLTDNRRMAKLGAHVGITSVRAPTPRIDGITGLQGQIGWKLELLGEQKSAA